MSTLASAAVSHLVPSLNKPCSLTGYSYQEILGFNCRFLQSPLGPGAVTRGSNRMFTESKVVNQMKEHLDGNVESQFSLVNYRKSGEPFVNLVAIIPLFFTGTSIVEFFVGFLVDMVEQPREILSRCKEGKYVANFQSDSNLPGSPTVDGTNMFKSFQTHASALGRSALNTNQIIPMQSDLAVSLADSRDLLMILSLRGRFLFVSPRACRETLDMDSSELLGKRLQDFVHPADIVAVVRELRNARSERSVSFLCRLRKANGDYVYEDALGHIFEGTNNTKKCYILSCRNTQPAVSLPFAGSNPVPIPMNFPSTTPDLWAKLSSQGHVIFASTTHPLLAGLPPPPPGSYLTDMIVRADRPKVSACVRDAFTTRRCIVLHSSSGGASGGFVGAGKGDGSGIGVVVAAVPEVGTGARHVFVGIWIGSDVMGRVGPFTADAVASLIAVGHAGSASNLSAELQQNNQQGEGTSLHYTINQLKVENRKLRDALGV
ncbi:blue light receptor [Entophlyctis luteolus]|nr:blue light receptor [Entophlyctis luteolus]